MKKGTVCEGDRELFEVWIEGRGGDSAGHEYFETEDDAILASAVDGENRVPTKVRATRFSDGTWLKGSSRIGVSRSPTAKEIQSLKQRLEEKIPTLRILFKA